ncbi:MAG: hypothetical protein Q9169_008626 [Polycauliona sp. 2 TL-2023]
MFSINLTQSTLLAATLALLAQGAPVSDVHSFGRRYENQLCAVKYDNPTQGAIDWIRAQMLRNSWNEFEAIEVPGNDFRWIGCHYGTVAEAWNDNVDPVSVDWTEAHQAMIDITSYCAIPTTDLQAEVPAFQIFTDSGYNILVRGEKECGEPEGDFWGDIFEGW